MRALRDNGLSLMFGLLFLLAVVAQGLVGHVDFNERQATHGEEAVSLGHYLSSSQYWVDVMENWQSEYLQFSLYIFATVWFVQRGSTEAGCAPLSTRTPSCWRWAPSGSPPGPPRP